MRASTNLTLRACPGKAVPGASAVLLALALAATLVAPAFAPASAASASAESASATPAAAYHPGTVVVGLAEGVDAGEVAGLDRVGEVVTVLEALDAAVLRVTPGTVDEAVTALARLPGVAYAERNMALPLADEHHPDDDRLNDQYAVTKINAVDGWAAYNDAVAGADYAATGGTTVAVVDSGIDADHPEFDFDGKIDDCKTWMSGTGARVSGCDDTTGHGTGVAGIAAAAADNGQGIAGVGFDAEIMALRACVDACFVVDIAAAIQYAVDHGARVLNYSFAGGDSTVVREAVEYAAGKGALQAAAAGNRELQGTPADTGGAVGFPAAYEEVIAVGATDENDDVPSFSARGDDVEVAAPGDDVLTTRPTGVTGDYAERTGTSFSSPHVAGLGALLINLGVSAEEARVAVAGGADDIDPPATAAGAGRINVANSVDIALAGEFTGALAGTVTDAEDGGPIGTATVIIVNADGERADQATTDDQGRYGIEDLDPGEYTVTAEAAGYESASKAATVVLGESRTLDLALTAEQAEEDTDAGDATADETTADDATADDATADEITDQDAEEDPVAQTGPDTGGGGSPASDPETDACPSEAVPSAGFTDVGDGNVHAAAIDCVAWYGISQGTSATTYTPAGVTTRAQMAAFVARTMEVAGVDLGAPGDQGFTDVAGHPQQRRINQLAAAGVVQGTTDTTYSPQTLVTRAQMASFLVRAYERITGAPLPEGESGFTDVTGNVHRANIDKAADAGWARGVTATVYDPGGGVRRDQQASFLARMLDDLVGEGLASPPAAGG